MVSSNKGRLSFFKQWLQSCSSVHDNVSNFVYCLSFLDGANKTATNYSSVRTVLYHARCVFPNARLTVVSSLPRDNVESSSKNTILELLEMLKDKRPADCQVITAQPTPGPGLR